MQDDGNQIYVWRTQEHFAYNSNCLDYECICGYRGPRLSRDELAALFDNRETDSDALSTTIGND